MSYGDVAKAAGLPNHSRWVGRALQALPKNSNLPWHRVIKSSGHIAFPSDSESFRKQCQRLKKEGVMIENGRCSLTRYRWQMLHD